MLRIDSHTHAFSEKIAAKVVDELVSYYGIPTANGACLPDLLVAADAAGFDEVFVLVAATKGSQVRPANDWILAHQAMSPADLAARYRLPRAPRIEWFAGYHPDDASWESELDRLRAAGVRGIKLHPEFQGFDLLDPRLLAFYEKIQDHFVVLTHMGDPHVSPANFSTPRKVARILDLFPRLRLVAAHLGGIGFWDEVAEVLAGREVYLDTSTTLPFIRRDHLRAILRKHDRRRILFGSDYPLGTPKTEVESFLALELDELSVDDKERILGANARELFRR